MNPWQSVCNSAAVLRNLQQPIPVRPVQAKAIRCKESPPPTPRTRTEIERAEIWREERKKDREAKQKQIGQYILKHADEMGRTPSSMRVSVALKVGETRVIEVMKQLAFEGRVFKRERRWYVANQKGAKV